MIYKEIRLTSNTLEDLRFQVHGYRMNGYIVTETGQEQNNGEFYCIMKKEFNYE